jgi:hypothetical protein
MIEIVYYSEILDSWGKTNSSNKPEIIIKVLNSPEEFTDDMSFQDKIGNIYSVDDLIGKEVLVGVTRFIVKDCD